MKHITIHELRALLDEVDISNRILTDKAIAIGAFDEKNNVRVEIVCFVEFEKFEIFTTIPAPELKRIDALEFCNQWNEKNVVPKIHVGKDNDVQCIYSTSLIPVDEEISGKYVVKNIVHILFATRDLLVTFDHYSKTGVFKVFRDKSEDK